MRQHLMFHGAGDDLLVVAGPVQDEFYIYGDNDGRVTLSDGTGLRLRLTTAGFWEIELTASGASSVSIVEAAKKTGDPQRPGVPDYTAVATISGPIEWFEVVHAHGETRVMV